MGTSDQANQLGAKMGTTDPADNQPGSPLCYVVPFAIILLQTINVGIFFSFARECRTKPVLAFTWNCNPN
jgi:hypothetical protein